MSQHRRSKTETRFTLLLSSQWVGAIATIAAIAFLAGCTNQSQLGNGSASPSPAASEAVASPKIAPSPAPGKSQATRDLEGKLSRAFIAATQVPLETIDCPAQFDVKAGNRFNCQASSGGQSFTIAIELTNPDGQFQWNTQGLLLLSRLEQFIQNRVHAKGGLDVTADCGGKIRVAQPGDTFECKVTGAQAQSRSAQVKVKDAQGSVDISVR